MELGIGEFQGRDSESSKFRIIALRIVSPAEGTLEFEVKR
jgi:hypothetical protein